MSFGFGRTSGSAVTIRSVFRMDRSAVLPFVGFRCIFMPHCRDLPEDIMPSGSSNFLGLDALAGEIEHNGGEAKQSRQDVPDSWVRLRRIENWTPIKVQNDRA
jgi:hypothetical protein